MLLGNSYIQIIFILPVISLCVVFFLSDLVHAGFLLSGVSDNSIYAPAVLCCFGTEVPVEDKAWDVDLC